MHFFSKKIIIFICVATLTACGGGGGGSSEPTPPSTPRPTVNLSAEPLSVLTGNETTLSWTTTNATTCSASGSWSGQKATSGSESATINTTGNNQFSLSCSGPGGSGSASVIVEGYENASGFVVDGYITGAEVFIDQDGNFISDNSDESTQSDSSGNFIIKKTAGDYVSIGGIDFDTQNSLDKLLLWHKNFQEFDLKAITPVTSVASFLQEPTTINDMLGIAADINVFIFDPVANKGDSGPNDFLYEKGNQLTTIALTLQNAINEVNNSLDTSQNIFLSISNVLSNNFNATGEIVNIESIEFLDSVMTDLENSQSINLSQESRDNIITALSSILPIIEVKTNDSVTTGIFDFATSTLQTDVRLIANGSASLELIDKYKTDMLNYVAEDQNLDPADIVPEIIANDDNYSTNEDTNISFNILANDSFVINSQLNITLGAPTNGSIDNDNGVITYSPNENYFGSDEFSYVLEQGGLNDTAEVRIIIDSINDEPEILSSNYQIDENTKDVGIIRATDVETQDLTYSIREGDSASLDLIGNNLSFKENTNYEEKDEYEFVASVSDGTAETQKNLKIFISDVNEPPSITSESEFTIDENSQAVGQVIVSDPDNNSLTYSLFKADAVAMSINNEGFITLNENANFESKDSYSIQVRVTDGEFTDTQDILINVIDLNDAPVFTTSNQFSINENSVLVGSVLATDEDQDSLVYSVEGNDAALFDISELADGTGLSISFKAAPNYEVDKQSYNLTVAVADNNTIVEQALTINVLDINDAPSAIDAFPSIIEIPENGGTPFTIQSTSCTDPRYFICSGSIHIGNNATQYQFEDEDGDTITFGLSGADANDFANTQNGSYLIKEFADFETKSQYSINLELSDGDLVTEVPLLLTVINENEKPEILTESFLIDENETQVGVVQASDPEGDSLRYSIGTPRADEGPDGGLFDIGEFTGNLTFKNPPDYETKSSYVLRVFVQDTEGLFSEAQDITVTLNNLNDNAPVLTGVCNKTTWAIQENETNLCNPLSGEDADGDTFTFSISGDDLEITQSNQFRFKVAPDYESGIIQYLADLTVSDGKLSTIYNMVINVIDRDEPAAPAPTNSTVFINEFHYDDARTNVGEFIEIIGPAATNLEGYRLSLISGENGLEYLSVDLDGIIQNENDSYGFKVINFDNQLRNGGTEEDLGYGDGIALIDASGICIELISYEGQVQPLEGSCKQYYSTEIPVSEGNANEPRSIQKIGEGTKSSDFAWVANSVPSKGYINQNQDIMLGSTLYREDFQTYSNPPAAPGLNNWQLKGEHYDRENLTLRQTRNIPSVATTCQGFSCTLLVESSEDNTFINLTSRELITTQDGGLHKNILFSEINNITVDHIGFWRFSFDTKLGKDKEQVIEDTAYGCGHPGSIGVSYTPARCHAFIKIIDPSDDKVLIFQKKKTNQTDRIQRDFEKHAIDFEISNDHVGMKLQFGFMTELWEGVSTNPNLGDMRYDNLSIRKLPLNQVDTNDIDGDGLKAYLETQIGTKDILVDSDRDGLSDSWEFSNLKEPAVANYIIEDESQFMAICAKGDLPFGDYQTSNSLRRGSIYGCSVSGSINSQAYPIDAYNSSLVEDLYFSTYGIMCVIYDKKPECWVNKDDAILKEKVDTSVVYQTLSPQGFHDAETGLDTPLYNIELGSIPNSVKQVQILTSKTLNDSDNENYFHVCGIRTDHKFFCSNIDKRVGNGGLRGEQLFDLVEAVKEYDFEKFYAYSGSEFTDFCGLLTDKQTIKCFYQMGYSSGYSTWNDLVEVRTREDIVGEIRDFNYQNAYACVLDLEGVKCWMPIYGTFNTYYYEDFTFNNSDIVSVDNYFDYVCWTTATVFDCAFSRTRASPETESTMHKLVGRSNVLASHNGIGKIKLSGEKSAYIVHENGIDVYGAYNGKDPEMWKDYSTPYFMRPGSSERFFADPDGDLIQSYHDKAPLNPAIGASNSRPVFTNATGVFETVINVNEGDKFVTTLQALDPDGDELKFFKMNTFNTSFGCNIGHSPLGDMQFFNLSESGELAFIDEPDYEAPIDVSLNFPSSENDNIYEFCVRVTDGASNDFAYLSIIVNDVED